jgi:hypothetical protein
MHIYWVAEGHWDKTARCLSVWGQKIPQRIKLNIYIFLPLGIGIDYISSDRIMVSDWLVDVSDDQCTTNAHVIKIINQRLPGACNRSPESKLLSITTQLHCGGHLGGRARLPDTILEKDHPMTIPSKFGSNWATGSRQDGFYANFP